MVLFRLLLHCLFILTQIPFFVNSFVQNSFMFFNSRCIIFAFLVFAFLRSFCHFLEEANYHAKKALPRRETPFSITLLRGTDPDAQCTGGAARRT